MFFLCVRVNRLNDEARNLIADLGSSSIGILGFRDNWVFVGGKGIKTKSPFEQVFALYRNVFRRISPFWIQMGHLCDLCRFEFLKLFGWGFYSANSTNSIPFPLKVIWFQTLFCVFVRALWFQITKPKILNFKLLNQRVFAALRIVDNHSLCLLGYYILG